MANVNKVILLGRITRDVELRYTSTGTAVAELGMAVNRYRKDDNGQSQEEVTFVDVTLWARQAELASQYLEKGRQVYIEGRLDMDEWEDKTTGKKRTKLKIVGENMQFIGGGESGGQKQQQAPRQQAAPRQQSAPQQQPAYAGGGMADEDIPF